MKTCVVKFFAGSGIRLAVLSLLFLGLAGVCMAQASAAPARPAAPAAAAPQAQPAAQAGEAANPEKPAPKGTQEGIHVSGHWVIEVKNPDGTVAVRREFENSLITPTGFPNASLTGSQFLVALLSGNAFVPSGSLGQIWGIQLSSVNNGDTSPCTQQSLFSNNGITGIPGTQSANNCQIVPTITPPAGTVVSTQSSTPPYTTSSSLPAQFTIAGTVQATQAGTIDTVFTLGALKMSGGTSIVLFPFSTLTLGLAATGTTPATPPVVPVVANQTISATVIYSFQ
ncbi:MAG: hypothetical protein ABSA85_06980 [Terracidiphilus sp.]|jgi:hypothetical protein